MGQGTSAAGDPQVEWTSAAEDLETEEVPEILSELETDDCQVHSPWILHSDLGTLSDLGSTLSDIGSTPSDLETAEHIRSMALDRQINGTTAAAEHTESGQGTHWPKNSIFRVPEHIRSSRESNFKPKLVSIGPYYHGERKLQPMEGLKIRCIKEILKMLGIAVTRTNHPRPREAGIPLDDLSMYHVSVRDSTLQEETGIDAEFLRQFSVSGRKAQAYYKEEFKSNLDEDRFVKMLLLDSCFVIRTIFAFSQQTQSMSFLDVHIKEVRSDLLLLDNQIPLFFIKEVYEWFLNNLKDKQLPEFNAVLEPFICLDMPWRINPDAKPSEAAHLLDLYWRYSL